MIAVINIHLRWREFSGQFSDFPENIFQYFTSDLKSKISNFRKHQKIANKVRSFLHTSFCACGRSMRRRSMTPNFGGISYSENGLLQK